MAEERDTGDTRCVIGDSPMRSHIASWIRNNTAQSGIGSSLSDMSTFGRLALHPSLKVSSRVLLAVAAHLVERFGHPLADETERRRVCLGHGLRGEFPGMLKAHFPMVFCGRTQLASPSNSLASRSA